MRTITIFVTKYVVPLFTFLFGNCDYLLRVFISVVAIDYITGICKAFIKKKVNSSIGAKGIVKKVAYLCVITISVFLDQLLKTSGFFRTIVISSFLFNEILSVLENCGAIGIKIPKALYFSLEKLNKDKEFSEKSKKLEK